MACAQLILQNWRNHTKESLLRAAVCSPLCPPLTQKLQAGGSLRTLQRKTMRVYGIIGGELRSVSSSSTEGSAKVVLDSLQTRQRGRTGVRKFTGEQEKHVRKFHIFKDSKMFTS